MTTDTVQPTGRQIRHRVHQLWGAVPSRGVSMLSRSSSAPRW